MFNDKELEMIYNVFANLKFATSEVQQHILAAGILEKIAKAVRPEPEGKNDAAENAKRDGE